MTGFNIPLVEEGLTAYAAERQNGFERHQRQGAPPWADTRRFWTDAVLQGMARLEGREPDPKQMERFDHNLAWARGSSAAQPATYQLQRDTIRAIGSYLAALESAGGDRRRQIAVVRDLLEDMSTHLPWAAGSDELHDTLDRAERMLPRMTAAIAPIRFTRILLGWERGPCESGYASGAVTTPEQVMETQLYRDLTQRYPEVADWPAVCVVYRGGGRDAPIGVGNATEFDLEIMDRSGDRFLELHWIRWMSGPYEFSCGPVLAWNVLRAVEEAEAPSPGMVM